MQEKKEKTVNKNRRRAGWVFVFLLALIFLLSGILGALLYVPSIQNFAADRLVKKFSKSINGDIKIGQVGLNIFKGLVVDDFIVTDKNSGDTVLFAESVNASLGDNLLSLFKQRADIKTVELSGLSLSDVRGQKNTYTRLSDLFKRPEAGVQPDSIASDPGSEKPKAQFDLSIDEIILNNFRYTYLDSIKGETRHLLVSKARILIDSLNLEKQDFYVSKVESSKLNFDITFFEKSAALTSEESITLSDGDNDRTYAVPDTFDLYVSELIIEDGAFDLEDFTKAKHPIANEFDPAHIIAKEIDLVVSNFYTNSQAEISARIEEGSLVSDDEQIEIRSFHCDEFALTKRRMTFAGLLLKSENSLVKDNLVFKFRDIKDFNDFNNKVIMEGNIDNSLISIRELDYFAPAMKKSPFFVKNQNRQISLSARVFGRVNSLNSPRVDIRLGDEVAIRGRMNSRNLADVDDALLNLDLDEFSMTVSTLNDLIPSFNPPPNFYKLGRLNFDGRFDGYLQDFVAYGDLSSDLGYADLDMRLDLKEGSEKAQYSGSAILKSFDLAAWSGNPELGILEMEAEVKDGKGLRLESVYAELQANVNVLEYKGYVYEDFSMEGKFEQNLFDGTFLISDPNIDLDFSGTIDFTHDIPEYDFEAQVKSLKLKKLNILEDDFGLEGNLVINANGTDINNAQGIASGSSFILYKDGNQFSLDSFNLTAKGAYPERRNFVLQSSLADIELNGFFKIEELPDAFLASLKRNYPNFTKQITHFKYPDPSPGYDFNIDMTVRESEDIFEVLIGESIFIRDATVLGRISDATNRSALNISFPFLEVNGNVFGGISGDLFAQEDQGSLSFLVEYSNINGVEFSPVKIDAKAAKEELLFAINSAELLDSFTDIKINGVLQTQGELFKVKLEETSFVAFGSTWEFNDQNSVTFGTESIEIEDLILSDGERALSFNDIDKKGVAMNIKALNTSFFNRLSGAEMRGEIDGAIEVDNIFDFQGLNASLNIPSFGFEEHEFGKVSLEAKSENFDEPVSYTLIAYDQKKNLRFDGEYNIDLKENQGELKVNAYPLDLLEYIITDGLSGTKGTFDASVKYDGPFIYPEINGNATVTDGEAKVDYLGTVYKVGENSIKFSEGYMDFSNGELIDARGQKAVVQGGMSHKAFRDFAIDLRIRSPQFIGLNTTKRDNPSYYGFAQGEVDVLFTGPFETINISVNATTGRNTVLNLPVEYTAEEYSTDFIEIIEYDAQEETKEREEISLDGLSLDMNVNVTQDARVVILFDESAKDILESSGRGAIRLAIDPEGNFEMFGNYEVVSGQYLFTIPSLYVNKSFNIQNGGSIEWTGDPLNANLDIDATYRSLQTSLTTFLEEYLPNPDGATSRLANQAKQRTDVSLTMDLGGTMSTPDIDFDISFPNLVGELKPIAEGKLRTLEANQDAYNDQVFGLILLRTFLPSNNNQVGNNLLSTSSLTGTAYSTISEFVSNQFSILLSSLFDEALQGNGYLTGVDVSLSANKNALAITADNFAPDEYDFNFVSSFDEDKWNIQVGGSYVVNSAFDVGTYFAPDFVVEYYITEDRRLKLNLYARSDYDASRSRRIQSGIGIAFRKEFNNLFDFAKAVNEEAALQ